MERRKSPKPTEPYMLSHNGDWKKKFEHVSWYVVDGSLRNVAYVPCQTWPMMNPLKDRQAIKMAKMILAAFKKDFP